ncbi:MAG: HEAT repeat domain-containing protein [Polyangiaceae bacterium]
MRAVERLGALGSPEAAEALLEALEPGSPLSRDPAARLYVVRTLGPMAAKPEVRAFLLKEMMDAGARKDASGFASLVRDTAALALARYGDAEAVQALANAAALRGGAGESARAALVAAPPRSLDSLLFEITVEEPVDEPKEKPSELATPSASASASASASGSAAKPDAGPPKPKTKKTPRLLTASVITLLGDLGDVRAVPALRGELDRSDRPTRAAAALALAKIGDATVAPVVRQWIEEHDPRFVLAAAEILVVLGDSSAADGVEKALAFDSVRSQALKLAHDSALPALAAPIAKLLPSLEGADKVRAVMALGRMGDATTIAKLVTDPALGPAAIAALGGCRASEAASLITEGLKKDDAVSLRAFVRAAMVRKVQLGSEVSGLSAAVAKLAASKAPADAEAAAFARVVTGAAIDDVLGKDPSAATVAGAARGALARDDEARAAFAPLLAKVDPEAPTALQVAAGVALLSTAGSDQVQFDLLFRMAESGGALGPLAARALARRIDDSHEARLLALLDGSDPSVRVGVALGLAEAPPKAAVSWLARAYLREEDVLVRRAIVSSLAIRTELQRELPLRLASTMDPDNVIRSVATAALAGQRAPLRETLSPNLIASFAVRQADASADPGGMLALRLVLPSGEAIPLVAAADGSLLVPGVPFGRSSLEVASTALLVPDLPRKEQP